MRHKQRHFPEPGYVPKFYGYCRVSHKSQNDRGTSIADQESRIKAYYQMLLTQEGQPKYEFGGMFVEPVAQSAYSKPFPRRPAGGELKALLNPTDQVCVEKFDRIFRDLEDFAVHRRWFKERAIGFHIVSFFGNAFDANSQLADMILPIFAGLGEMESTIKSERMLLARSSRRAEGRHAGTAPPFFCMVIDNEPGKKIGGRLVLKDWAERVCQQIIFLYDHEGMNWLQLSQHFWRAEKRDLNSRKLQDLYGFWKHWNNLNRPDLNTFKMRDFIDTYWRENPRTPPKVDNPFDGKTT